MSALGRYLLRERIGAGGMGEVFLAVTLGAAGFEKKVVVKRLLPAHAADEVSRTLFMAEALLLTKLGHPNVVSVLDFGTGEQGDYFVVLEHVDGLDLGALLRAIEARGERLGERFALRVASQVLRGLGFAHELAAAEGKTLVHRDVTPGNVLLSKAGEVKIADFGVTLVADAGAAGDGVVAGKPGYMSPEQRARRPLDPRSDLYSVGVLLFRMIAGRLPTPVEEGIEPEPLEASPNVAAIVARALAHDPEARFARAKEMLAAIEAEPLASADELGALVEEAFAEAPPKREAVVVIGRGGHDDRELRATEITIHREPTSPPPAPTPAPPSARRVWPILVLPLALIGTTATWFALRPQSSPTIATNAPDAGPAIVTASTSAIAVPIPTPSATASAPVLRSASSTQASRMIAPATSRSATSSSASAPPSDCRGAVWLRADHAWTVTAGALTAEAPDRASWPCGAYDVVAVSKLDPKDHKRLTITVSPTATATIDLR